MEHALYSTIHSISIVQICVKRGPLGACRKTEKRTKENDNDKATKYFNDPELKFQEKYRAAQLQAIEDERNGVPAAGSAEFDGNALVARLKRQTEENRAKNDAVVRKQTLQNNLVSVFLCRCLILFENDVVAINFFSFTTHQIAASFSFLFESLNISISTYLHIRIQ